MINRFISFSIKSTFAILLRMTSFCFNIIVFYIIILCCFKNIQIFSWSFSFVALFRSSYLQPPQFFTWSIYAFIFLLISYFLFCCFSVCFYIVIVIIGHCNQCFLCSFLCLSRVICTSNIFSSLLIWSDLLLIFPSLQLSFSSSILMLF